MTVAIHWSEMDQKFWINDGDEVLWFDSALEAKDAAHQIELRNAVSTEVQKIADWFRRMGGETFANAIEAREYRRRATGNPTDERVIAAADVFSIHPRDLISPYQYDFLRRPRFALAKALRMTGMPLKSIGRIVNRDHKTVMYQVRQAEYFMERDPDYKAKIEGLAERFSDDRD